MSNTKKLKKLGSQKTNYIFDKPNKKLLEIFDNLHLKNDYLVPIVMPYTEFSSLCPKTKQPDWAKIEIIYIPNKNMIESKSLKLYLFSFRNHGEFHEDCINRITNDLFSLLKPKYIRVIGNFNPRGGLAIIPIVEKKGVNFKNYLYQLVTMWDTKQLNS